jgi:mRNA interferase MazF
MKRGEIWTLRDDNYAAKARPVVVIQTNSAKFNSVIVCLLTTFDSCVIPTRVAITPTPVNGLQKLSYVMTEKILTINQTLLKTKIGELSDCELRQITAQLAKILGINKQDLKP